MGGKNILHDLVTLVKVFDVNYVTDEDAEKLSDLDVNHQQGVDEAVRLLLMPEFLGYTEVAQARLLHSLKSALADPQEDFGHLFDRVEFAFDEPVGDRKRFMRALLSSLESSEFGDRGQVPPAPAR